MYKGLSISVVIPCFNEEEGIAHVLRGLPDYVDEAIVVDNNSTDGTAEVARELGARVIHESCKGYGSAYQAGLPAATGDIIATVDGDGTYPSAMIAPLIDRMLARRARLHLGQPLPVAGRARDAPPQLARQHDPDLDDAPPLPALDRR